MTFSCEDLEQLTELVAAGWRSAADRDWSASAGTLDWSCTKTADHAVDTVLAPAFFLASRNQETPGGVGWELFTMGPDAQPEHLAAGLETATRVLTAVVLAAGPDVRAAIWRRPRVETRGPADFVPRGALELILHAHDVATGLGIRFEPTTELCDRLREHTQSWPHWSSPGWSPLTMTGDAWPDLLQGSGRNPS